MKRSLAPYYPGFLLFFIFFVVAIFTYKDHGISWDEPIQRNLGLLTYERVVHNNLTILSDGDRALGTAFELPLIFMEKVFHLTDTREIYAARHLATHLFFLFSVFCGYVLALRLFHSRVLACLAFLMLVLHPRIYAHSFMNSKDIPFLSAFLITMLCFHIAFEKRKVLPFILLGIACAYASAIRLIGVMWLGAVFIFVLSELISKRENIKVLLIWGVAFLSSFVIALYAFWPFLWNAPVKNMLDGYKNLSTLASGGRVLFNGAIVTANPLPKLYMPEWFCITMPEVWLLTGIAGILLVLRNSLRKAADQLPDPVNRYMCLYLFCFLLPPVLLILVKAAIIDDWRHLYFVYPAFVMLVLYALNCTRSSVYYRPLFGAHIVQVVVLSVLCIHIHPYQQVYFNYLLSHKQEYFRRHFDYEYWGCAYANGLQYILSKDDRPVIKVYGEMWLVQNAILILPPEQRSRVRHVWKDEEPDYFMTNYRCRLEEPQYPLFYTISAMNNTVLAVFKIK